MIYEVKFKVVRYEDKRTGPLTSESITSESEIHTAFVRCGTVMRAEEAVKRRYERYDRDEENNADIQENAAIVSITYREDAEIIEANYP